MPVLNARQEDGCADRAHAYLRTAILEGRLTPGTPLSRRRIGEELGMSSAPVAEAMARLETESLVESRARAGTRVRIATPHEIHGNYVLREALETHSARLFAAGARQEYREKLLLAAARLDEAYIALAGQRHYNRKRHARVERIHIAFHMRIARATGVPVLTAAIERSRVLLFNWLFTVSTEFSRFPERWHRDLAGVLVAGTPDHAAEAMRTHVQFRQAEVIDRFRELAGRSEIAPRMVRGPQRRTAALVSCAK